MESHKHGATDPLCCGNYPECSCNPEEQYIALAKGIREGAVDLDVLKDMGFENPERLAEDILTGKIDQAVLADKLGPDFKAEDLVIPGLQRSRYAFDNPGSPNGDSDDINRAGDKEVDFNPKRAVDDTGRLPQNPPPPGNINGPANVPVETKPPEKPMPPAPPAPPMSRTVPSELPNQEYRMRMKSSKAKKYEAYGLKGMKSTPWRKQFNSYEEAETWADKNNAEIKGWRETEESKTAKTADEADHYEVRFKVPSAPPVPEGYHGASVKKADDPLLETTENFDVAPDPLLESSPTLQNYGYAPSESKPQGDDTLRASNAEVLKRYDYTPFKDTEKAQYWKSPIGTTAILYPDGHWRHSAGDTVEGTRPEELNDRLLKYHHKVVPKMGSSVTSGN